jgi:thiol-disulfide isomerase/thioredoxin
VSDNQKLNLESRGFRLVAGGLLVAAIFGALFVAGLLGGSGGAGDIVVRPANTEIETPGSDVREVGLREGQLAPDFEATDFDGNRVRLSDFRGRAVLLNFWATWCAPCRAELPEIQNVLMASDAGELAVVEVNYGESLEDARDYIEELEIVLTRFVLDPELDVVGRYDLQGMPMTYFIDAEGVITRVYVGRASQAQLEAGASEAIAGAAARSTP